ncbi:hypothetical protein WAK64_06010 [Bacillus spongiae]|uniref:GNAT family N-acetyltransferase n=1 Tax=Bacillus spongiae TaxID=2683610 RepID=A0ABU8HBF3_9BACI
MKSTNEVRVRKSTKEDLVSLMELDNIILNEKNTPVPVIWTSVEDFSKQSPADGILIKKIILI